MSNRIGQIESCPSCHQPADEPCPSSCGVSIKFDMTAEDVEKLFNSRPGDVVYVSEQPVLRTREEWEERGNTPRYKDALCWQALGLLSCLHPEMPIDTDDPLGMARKISEHVKAELAALREKVADRDFEVAKLAGHIRDHLAELERLRKGVMPNAGIDRSHEAHAVAGDASAQTRTGWEGYKQKPCTREELERSAAALTAKVEEDKRRLSGLFIRAPELEHRLGFGDAGEER